VNRRRPDIRIRVLRWLLVLVALAGAGVLQGGHCLTHTAPLVTTLTMAATAAHLSTAEADGHDHLHADRSVAPHTHTTADDCHLAPAPSTAATITSSSMLAPPTTAIRIAAVEAPVPVRRPRLPVAVTLTAIGISRI
jgi:hypothetical protein